MRFLVDECTGPALDLYSDKLVNSFTIVTENTIRILKQEK